MENKLKHLMPPSSEITPEHVYLSRRNFLKAMGLAGAGAVLAACAPAVGTQAVGNGPTPTRSGETDELGDPVNSYDDITNYNNYYEFSTSKEAVNPLSKNFQTRPWSVEVGGLVNKPQTFAIEDLLKFQQKERIYRLRCVEAWSMVIPWTGFELGDLLRAVEPQGSAKYVAFTTLMDKKQFPGEGDPFYPWPYKEGLRLDEAMQVEVVTAAAKSAHSCRSDP